MSFELSGFENILNRVHVGLYYYNIYSVHDVLEIRIIFYIKL